MHLDVRTKVCNTNHHTRRTLDMYSQMFRRETARRLLAITDQVIDAYRARRSPWLNAHLRLSGEAIKMALEMIVASVADEDSTLYHRYAVQQTLGYLELGMPPIAVLAAADLLYEIVLGFLSADQRELVVPILDAQRLNCQHVVRDYMQRHLALAGA